MKKLTLFAPLLLLFACSRENPAPETPSSSTTEDPPSLPRLHEVYAAFRDDDIHGPSKDSIAAYTSVEDLITAWTQATYLGRDLETDQAPWRSDTSYGHQGWTIITTAKQGAKVRIHEARSPASPKDRFFYISYFDAQSHARGGMRHHYYYKLPPAP